MTKPVPVAGEMVAQHVAFWSASLAVALVAAVLFSEISIMRAPKEASVARTEFVPGILTLPKRTAVPGGEERVSAVERDFAPFAPFAPVIGKMDMKPVLLTVGSPFMVVMRAVS